MRPKLTPFSCFSKLTRRTAIRAYVARLRSCLLETDNPGQRKKKQLKVSNRLSTCHETKQVLRIKLSVFILLSTGNSHPLHYIASGLFCCCKCHLGCHKATKRSCAEEKQTSGCREIHKGKRGPLSRRANAPCGPGPQRIQVARSADSRRN